MIELSGEWREAHGREIAYRLAAATLALAIFAIDTFTSIQSAIAVLYVFVLLIVADTLSRRGIMWVAAGCAGLAVLSFSITHGLGASFSEILRLAVALAAILITTALLLRHHASRQELIAANAALARSERRFRSIFEHARVSLWEQDYSRVREMLAALRAQGVTDIAAYAEQFPEISRQIAATITTIDVNEATLELLGATSRDEVLGPLDRFLPADAPGLIEVVRALFEGRDYYEGRGRIIDLDGRTRTVLVGLTFPDDDAGFTRVVASLVDITEREQTQQALLAAQAELARASRTATIGALSASIAHELNQPLAALVINAQALIRWLRREPPDLEAASQAAERMARDGMRASEIVQRTRSMLVRGERRDETIDLRQLTDEVVGLLEHELNVHSARIRTHFVPDAASVTANRVEMQQVLINLIMNGLHAMAECLPSMREIAVAIDCPDASHVRLSVRDRGIGMTEDNLAKIFDPFFTTKSDGMGMGLAIVRSTIEAGGGRLTARNHEEGGAVFEFVLPAFVPVEN